MRALSAIATLCSALTLIACGAGDSATTTTTTTTTTTAAQSSESGTSEEARSTSEPKGSNADRPIAGASGPPKVTVPPGPPPKKLVIKDLKLGSGPAAKPYSRLVVHFIGIDYETGKPFETQWGPNRAFRFEYDHGLPMNGWEKGLAGMKVGGRREVIVPASLGYEGRPLLYVVELLAAEDRSKYARPRPRG